MKTIAVIPNWNSIPRPETAYTTSVARISEWVANGKYTNQTSETFDNGARIVERWSWIDEAAADEYIAFVTELFGELYPGLQITKVAE